MKKVYSIMLVSCFALTIVACKKNKDNNNNDVVGIWELSKTTAAMVPNATEYPSGNGNILEFTATTYKQYSNGQVIKSGTYTIADDNTVSQSVCLQIDNGRYSHRIVFDGDNAADKTFFEISNGGLGFISGCYAVDAGHTSEYRRIYDIDGDGTGK